MNINELFLTKFKCLFNKIYLKKMIKSELRGNGSWKPDAGRNILL